MKRWLAGLSALLIFTTDSTPDAPTKALPRGSSVGRGWIPIAPAVSLFSLNRSSTVAWSDSTLQRSERWSALVFDVHDRGWGVWLALRGSVEFDRATVLLGDGTRMDLDLSGARRSNGLYALADFIGER